MKNDPSFDSDVLIVGAGPTGLALACGLRQLGISCMIIDKEKPVQHARAMGLSARSLEVLRALGVVQEVLSQAVVFRTMNIYLERLRVLRMAFDVSDHSSPTPYGAVLPQNQVVAILENRFRDLGGIVNRICELEGLGQDADGVTASINENGLLKKVRVQYVVGCDGAHSKVRSELGLKFAGSDYEDRLLAADVFVDWDLPSDGGHVFLGSNGTITAFPFPETGKWRLAVFGGNTSTDRSTDAVMVRLREVMKECGPIGAVVRDPVHTTFYGIHRRFVHNFRLGRGFVAGDAAHIHSPAGGQGMNTGIQDSFNLAWKLALVISGKGHDKLLDSYNDERRPVAEEVLKTTNRLTQVILPRNQFQTVLRDSALKFIGKFGTVGRNIGRTLSQLDVEYRNSPIVFAGKNQSLFKARSSPTRNSPRPGERAPDSAVAGNFPDEACRVFDLIYRNDSSHTLLIFEGLQPAEVDPAAVADLHRLVNADQIETYRILWPGSREKADYNVNTLGDPDGAIHRLYGAERSTLYLIRPDGYVGFRAECADIDGINRYFENFLLKESIQR